MNLRKIKKYVSVIALTAALVFSGFAVPTRADGYNQGIVTFVTSLYSDCLGRTPDPAGLNDWCSKLASGQISGKQCAYGFFFSPEFQAKANAWDDTTFINAYYKVFLNRASDPNGFAYWQNQIAGTTNDISILFTGFADSTEFAQKCASYGITAGAHINVPTTVRGSGSAQPSQLALNWAGNMQPTWFSYTSDGSGYESSNFYVTSETVIEYTCKVLNSNYNSYAVYYEVYYSPYASLSNSTRVYSGTITPTHYGDGNFYEFQYRNGGGLTQGYYQFVGYDTNRTITLFDVYAEVA